MNRLDFYREMRLVALGQAILIAVVVVVAAAGQEQPAVRMASVRPTVFFVKDKDALVQVADVEIESDSQYTEAVVLVKVDSSQTTTAIGKLDKGKTTLQVHVPEVTEPTQAEFILKSADKIVAYHKTQWQPQRRWEVYFVPITHHDLGYTDTIVNVLEQYNSFYDDVLRFCAETQDWPEEAKYRYTVEATWSLQNYVENRPKEQLDKLAKYVGQGRIEIGALFGNQISGLCSHEGLVRLMYPSFRLGRMLGGKIRTGSITDIPGLSWGLPMVMAGAGIRYFFAGLPDYFEWSRNDIHTFWDESAVLRHGRPDAFRWQGPDGQTVLVYYCSHYGYFEEVTGPHSYKEVMDHLPGKLTGMQKQGSPFSVVRYIHNGADNSPPQLNISHIVREWNNKWAYPRLLVATNTMFFEALEKQCGDIRTFRGELPDTDYVVGAISTARQTGINRLTHDKLHSAEKAAAIASLVGDYSYPVEKIRQAYDCVLLYDEHSWGKDYPAGHLQDLAWHEKSHYAYKAAALVEPVLDGSLADIAQKIELKDDGRHIVVFNSLSFKRTDVVRVNRFSAMQLFDLLDVETGHLVPYQIAKLDGPQATTPYAAYRYALGQFEGHELLDLVFVAEDVPSMGYKTYRLVPKDKPDTTPSSIELRESEIENRFFKVTLDSRTGAVNSIYDKGLSQELVDTEADHKLNQFVAKQVRTGELAGPAQVKIRPGQNGPVYGRLVATSIGPGCPQITQDVILYDKLRRIDFANRLLKDSTPLLEIYFAFPFKVDSPRFRYEGSNSVIEPLADQFPGSNSNYYPVQHWADVSDGQAGVTLAPLESHLLEFGSLWPCYVSQAHHGFTPPGFGRDFVKHSDLTKGHVYSFVMDSNFRTNFQPVQQGDMLFRYSLTTHQGDWKQGNCRNFGWAVANPLVPVVVSGKRQGPFPATASFCSVDKPNVLIVTLKRAEDDDGIIVRLVETIGDTVKATLSLPHLNIRNAYQTNLVEAEPKELALDQHSIEAPLDAFGITTIRIQTD